MGEPDKNGWIDIGTAPEGRCLMWVVGYGVNFGRVYIYPDERSYRPEGHHGNCTVTHWRPIPDPPVSTSHQPTQGEAS